MKADKLGMWLINLLMSAALAFSILVLMEQLPGMGWAWYSRSVCGLPVLICFVAGLIAREVKTLRYVLLPISALGAAAIVWLLFPAHGTVDIIFIVLCVFLGAGIFFIGLRGDLPFPPKVALAAIVLFIFDCAYFYLNTGLVKEIMPVTYCTLATFLLSLYSFNTNSLHNGLHNVKGGTVMAVPAGLRSRNILMLSVFVIIAVPLASMGFLHRGLSAGFGFLFRVIWAIMKALSPGGGDSGMQPQAPQESAELPETDVALDPGTPDGWFVPLFIIIVLILGLIGAIIVFVPKPDGRGGRGGLSELMKKLFKVRQVEAYEDSVERLLDLKGLLKKSRDSVKNFIDKLTAVPEKYEDMPDNRMKVRFAYKYLLKSSRVNQRAVYYTPRELSDQLGISEVRQLAEAYNTARYKEGSEITAEHEATAKAAMTAIRSKRR